MRPRNRGERTVDALAFVAIGLPLGVAYLVVLVVGGVASLVGFDRPAVNAVRRAARLERMLANRLLAARIPPIPLPPLPGGPLWQRIRAHFRRPAFVRALGLLALKLPATALAAAVIGATLLLFGALVVLGAEGVADTGAGSVGPFNLGPAFGVALWLLAVPAGVVAVAVTGALARMLRALAHGLLATRIPPGGPVREMLARSLGDRSLSIAYWLPDRETFVDERGHRVPLPAPGSNRAWTAVDYGGRRVAAIIHDANLDASPELVQAAAAAASLALDNERLKADLRARVEELRASRVRIVEAADAARRRLERDLHDGAQQQLVALAVDLRILRGRVQDNHDATELIGQIEQKLTAALAELRELARGIHPAILTDRGLEAALDSLADRSPLPVRADISLPNRPPAPVEAAAYFVAAEALTNALKYAQATAVTLRAQQEGDDIVVEIADDGVGGADEAWGSGLRGLNDRVTALDGALTVISPPGRGTFVQATIPCHAASLVEEATAPAVE
jgi:signal transduction histidine kinase